ncbi:hypothetical protein GTA08_BOTSDO08452 [Botryosphaeria dothidea]|uniref:Uncharacterized protein n=1 Tax=Botryosphaeria dothidea TaxID=55169 RepID=A0A8H4IP82_9PEZI|nr:hypothetical protein GTA08_BOTSDO08452 [Botryosphaeria dothidea]
MPPPVLADYQLLPHPSLAYRPAPANTIGHGLYNAQSTYTIAQGPSYAQPTYHFHADPQPLYNVQPAFQPPYHAQSAFQPSDNFHVDPRPPFPVQPPFQPTHTFQTLPFRPPSHPPPVLPAPQPHTYVQNLEYALRPRRTPTPTTMPPAKRRKTAAPATAPTFTKTRKTTTNVTSTPTTVTTAQPIEPCINSNSHFHRLRCGHVVKTALTGPPTACATNCEAQPQPDANDAWGAHPFACPVCIARALSMLWKMDVVNLKKQLQTLSFDAFAAWVHRNYVRAWEQRRQTRLKHWIPNARPCAQLSVRERGMVAWRADEARAPYPIEEYRRVYERREVHADFWNSEYRDLTVEEEQAEAEPGIVHQSVEREGVHYAAPGVHYPSPWDHEEWDGGLAWDGKDT